MVSKRHAFMTIKTIEGTPLKRSTPIDPVQYEQDLKMLEERGLRPPKPFDKKPAQTC
jgi:hypothetical protein